mmetsp:Transcript_66771/g.204339  ORF Transcript_66771/g.204339 Transcript_66771/m.204339 type:complete len:284 (-) Transcript_66771:371-1222(-)
MSVLIVPISAMRREQAALCAKLAIERQHTSATAGAARRFWKRSFKISMPPSLRKSDLDKSPLLLKGLTKLPRAVIAILHSSSSSHLWKRNNTAALSLLRKTTSLFGTGFFEFASTGNCIKSNSLQQHEESHLLQYSTTEMRESTACNSGCAFFFSASRLHVFSRFVMTMISPPCAAPARMFLQFITLAESAPPVGEKQPSDSSNSKLWLLAANFSASMFSLPGTFSVQRTARTFGVCAMIDFLTCVANTFEALSPASNAMNKSNILLYRLAFLVFFTLSTTYL